MTKIVEAGRSLIQAFREGAASYPEARLVVASDTRAADLGLAEIVARGRTFGAHLRTRGIGPGDVVAVQLPAWSEWLIACVGIFEAGAIMLPVVSIYGARELGFILRQSRAKALITPDRWRKFDYAAVLADCGDLHALMMHITVGEETPPTAVAFADLEHSITLPATAPRAPNDLAMLVFTSGTTADPKGVQHSSRTLLSEMEAVAYARRALETESTLSPWPPGHVAGACVMMRYMVQGVPLVLMDQWDATQAAKLIARHRISSGSFTPFHLTGILDAADQGDLDISSLVNCLVGAAPVPPSLIERCAARGMATYRSYGSSEHPTVTTGDPSDPIEKRLSTEGRAMLGSEIRFADDDGQFVPAGAEGEIVTRGPELFLGYSDERLNPTAFLPDGWYRTGDIGRLDEDGYLVITDRKKDVIIRGGENISSREVEDLLYRHPAVLEAAVVAAPDPRMGEIVRAYIVPREGRAIDLADVRIFFAEAGIARQKTPEQIVLVETLPRNSTGKVLKHELRARARREGASHPLLSI